MENKFRTIGYILLFAANAVMFWFLHSQFNYIVMILMIAMPVLSLLMGYLIKRYFSIELINMGEQFGKQNEELYFEVKLNNPTPFVSLDVKLAIKLENLFFKTMGKQVISVPLHAMKGYSLKLPIVATYPGIVKLSVCDIKIKDLLGFCFFRKTCEEFAEITVMPENLGRIPFDMVGLEQGMLESEESTKRGNDFSDVQEIREYIPGDKLMSIHWKLSAKRDILMVKDRVSMSDKQLVVVPELCGSDRQALNVILSATYSAILQMINSSTTVRLVYWSTLRYEYVDKRIDYAEDVRSAFAEMFYENTYASMDEAAIHMPMVYPEVKAYLHVTYDGSKAVLNVRENV